MNQITVNHGFGKSPGQQITDPFSGRITHGRRIKSRFERFPWSANHAANHANHASQITLGPPSLQEGGVPQPVVLPADPFGAHR